MPNQVDGALLRAMSGLRVTRTHRAEELESLAGGRALIPKNAFGWPTLCGFLQRVGPFSSPFF
jgi:hypothetical protein